MPFLSFVHLCAPAYLFTHPLLHGWAEETGQWLGAVHARRSRVWPFLHTGLTSGRQGEPQVDGWTQGLPLPCKSDGRGSGGDTKWRSEIQAPQWGPPKGHENTLLYAMRDTDQKWNCWWWLGAYSELCVVAPQLSPLSRPQGREPDAAALPVGFEVGSGRRAGGRVGGEHPQSVPGPAEQILQGSHVLLPPESEAHLVQQHETAEQGAPPAGGRAEWPGDTLAW